MLYYWRRGLGSRARAFSAMILVTALGSPNRTSALAPTARTTSTGEASPTMQRGVAPSAQEPPTTPDLTQKQKQDLTKANFEKMKRDADELIALARSLQEDLDKSSENVLSLKIVNKAEKIEKLARKIKDNARGN